MTAAGACAESIDRTISGDPDQPRHRSSQGHVIRLCTRPGTYKHLLEDFLGLTLISQHVNQKAEQKGRMTVVELADRSCVPSEDSVDQEPVCQCLVRYFHGA